uniref:Ribosomal protein L13 n=1 Tax=Nitzschia sp. PL1-4 TaxID=2083272 RepID=A0A2Z5ZB31_9STRA|nr:ribosomal protein L13 [Nitzschia sp. PL1-4]
MKKTFFIHKAPNSWYLIDCKNQSLGRISTYITQVLLGKNITTYSPSSKKKNYVVLINTNFLRYNKKKLYFFCYKPGQPGRALKIKKFSINTIKQTIKRMLPMSTRNKLIKQLKIYENNIYPHKGQVNQKINV